MISIELTGCGQLDGVVATCPHDDIQEFKAWILEPLEVFDYAMSGKTPLGHKRVLNFRRTERVNNGNIVFEFVGELT